MAAVAELYWDDQCTGGRKESGVNVVGDLRV
jgi:hypothetical protein